MTEQTETFKKLTSYFSQWQHLLEQAYVIDARQIHNLNLYDILNSPKVEQYLKRDKPKDEPDCPLLEIGRIDSKVLKKRWDIAYKIIRSSDWQNHKEAKFSGDIQKAFNYAKEKEVLTDPIQESAYYRWLNSAKKTLEESHDIKKRFDDAAEISAEYIRQGGFLLESKAYRPAIAKFNQAIQLQSTCEAFAGRALARYNLGENPKAEKDCNEAIRLDPNFAWVYVLRGKILHISNKPEEAIRDLNTAIQKLGKAIDRVNDEIKTADKVFDLSLSVELGRKLADLKRKSREAKIELEKIRLSQNSPPIVNELSLTSGLSNQKPQENVGASIKQQLPSREDIQLSSTSLKSDFLPPIIQEQKLQMYNLAELSDRLAAKFIDWMILLSLFKLLFKLSEFKLSEAISEIVLLLVLLFLIFYIFCKDGLKNGQSYGKRIIGICVIDAKSGKSCTFIKSFVRNVPTLLGIFDWIFIFSKKRQRLGDLLANTIVIREKSRSKLY